MGPYSFKTLLPLPSYDAFEFYQLCVVKGDNNMTIENNTKEKREKDQMLTYFEYYKKLSEKRRALIKKKANIRRLRPSLESYDPKWEK